MAEQVASPVATLTATLSQPGTGFPSAKKLTVPPLGTGASLTVYVTAWPTEAGLAEDDNSAVVWVTLAVVVVVVGELLPYR
jgi:hypothetical protein